MLNETVTPEYLACQTNVVLCKCTIHTQKSQILSHNFHTLLTHTQLVQTEQWKKWVTQADGCNHTKPVHTGRSAFTSWFKFMWQERGKQFMYLVPKTFPTYHETLPTYHIFSQFRFIIISLSRVCRRECSYSSFFVFVCVVFWC